MECMKIRPLDLPEIIATLGPFLSFRSQVECLCVCKLWYRVLVPYVWEEIGLGFSHPGCPNPSLIQKYGCFIQSLWIDYHLFLKLCHSAATFPILSSVVIKPTANGDPFDDPNLLVSFIERHMETLKSVRIDQPVNDAVLAALEDCPRLDSLSLMNHDHALGPTGWIHQLKNLWPRLRTLTMKSDYGIEPQQLTTTGTMDWPRPCGPSRIKDLDLALYCSQMVKGFCSWIVKQCPDLVRLRWHRGEIDWKSCMEQLTDIFENDPSFGRRLEDITLSYMDFNNKHFRALMGSLVRLRRLNLSRTNFSHQSWTILRTTQPAHLQTLTVLNLEDCSRLRGGTIHQILCEMPNLKILGGTRVVDKAIMKDSRPWVCLGLEVLTLELSLTRFSADPSVRSLVLQRYLALVGQLKRLGCLINFLPRAEDGSIFIIGLQHGLDALKDLRQLTHAYWADQYTGEDDIRWFLENWPDLESPPRTRLQDRLGHDPSSEQGRK